MEQDQITRVAELSVKLHELEKVREQIAKSRRLYLTAIGFLHDKTFTSIDGEVIRDMMLSAIDPRILAIAQELEAL